MMLAPNGKISNLSEAQWRTVRTEAFKKWFGDWENDPENASKAVDKNGEPLVVYHGTTRDFKSFQAADMFGSSKPRTQGGRNFLKKWIFFFTDDPVLAADYTTDKTSTKRGGENIIPVFLSIKKVVNINARGHLWKEYVDPINEIYKDPTNEGIIIKNVIDHFTNLGDKRTNVYIALDNKYIKSAIGNNGNFDIENRDITMAAGGQTLKPNDMNPFIGDNFFKQNPSKVLGTQTTRKGRFGSDMIVVEGSLSDIEKIDASPLPVIDIYPTQNLSTETEQAVIEQVFQTEEKETTAKKVKERRTGKKDKKQEKSTGADSDAYTFAEIDELYNKNISQDEKEAYYLTHPELNHKLLFEKFTNSKEKLVSKKLICWDADERKFVYVYTYQSGNIGKKISTLYRDKEKIVEQFSENQWQVQMDLLQAVKPKQKGLVGDDRLTILPHSNFSKGFKIMELRFGKPELHGETSLFNAFKSWLRHLPPDQFKKSNSREIIDYYLDRKSITISKDANKEQKAKEEKIAINISQRTKEEGDELFARFLSDELTPEDQGKLQFLWNEKFNSHAEPNLTKIPVCFRIGKKFKKGPLMLNPTQRQAAAFQTEKFSALLAYGVGVGKAHLLTSDILTPTGFKKMGELNVHDYVIGKNGHPTMITGVFPQGKRKCYEVIFSDGSKTSVSDEHLWSVQRVKQRDHKSKHWNTMTTAEIMKYGLYNGRGNYMFSIPMVEPIHFDPQPLAIDPYIMGCLIGDGGLSGKKTISFTCTEPDILHRISDNLPEGVSLKQKKYNNGIDYQISRTSMMVKFNPVFREIEKEGLSGSLSNSKFIPKKYLFNTLENRIKLLQGLIDTDGYIKTGKRDGKRGCTVIYYTVSEQLSKDVRLLCETLGGTASIKLKHPTFTHKGEKKNGQLCYCISLRLPPSIIPVFTKKKADRFVAKTKYQPIRFIEKINYIGELDCQCISVAAEDHLYVCEHCIVTHNTLASIVCFSQAYYNGYAKKGIFVVPTNTYDKWLGEIQGYTDKDSGEYMNGALPQLPPIVGCFNFNPTIVYEKIKDYSDKDNALLDSIMNAIEFLKKIKSDEPTQVQKDAASKIYPINWLGIDAQHRLYRAETKSASPKQLTDFTIDYLRNEYNYYVYTLGTVKSFPEGTIFVTTEVGLQRLGISEGNQGELGSKLYTILSQGEKTADLKSKRDVAALQLKIEQTISSSLKNAKLLVEDLGLDWVCFDEAHYYKKIFTFVKGDIAGEETKYNRDTQEYEQKLKRDKAKYELKSGSVPSSRALSAFVLSHFVQSKNNNRNVIQLTATPFTNSPLEVYSMLALTNYKALEDMGMASMVDFFDTFMKINYDIKYTPQKTVVKDVVLTGYNNLPQLRQLIYSLMDKKDEGASLKRPVKVIMPSVEKGIETTLPMTAEQNELMANVKKYIAGDTEYEEVCASALADEIENTDFDGLPDDELIATWEQVTQSDYEGERENLTDAKRDALIKRIKTQKISGLEISADELDEEESRGVRVLKGLSMMRQITASPYLYHKACRKAAGSAPEMPKYDDYVNSSPKFKYVMGCIESAFAWHKKKGSKPGGHVIYMNAGVEYFPLLKEYLVKKLGLKESQVGIVSGSMSKTAKENVKNRFLSGDILVLIGSSTISVGVDLQNNATTLYNCYYDWNPTDAAQIEGRIWRQGNRFAFVRIVYPQCYNSADPVIFEYLNSKTLRINEIWNRSSEVQELDLRDFNPKELQKKLITDPEEKAEWEILEETDKIEGEILFAENRRESLQNAMYAFKAVGELRPKVKDWMQQISDRKLQHAKAEAVASQKEKINELVEKYGDKPDKMADEIAKYKKSRYDHDKDPEGKYAAVDYASADDERLYNDCKKTIDQIDKWSHSDSQYGDLYYERHQIESDLQDFRNNYRDMKAADERVLKPMGLSFASAENPIADFDKKILDLRAQKEAIETTKADRVAKLKAEAIANKHTLKSVADRIAEFSAMNDEYLGPQLVYTAATAPIELPKEKEQIVVPKAEEKLKKAAEKKQEIPPAPAPEKPTKKKEKVEIPIKTEAPAVPGKSSIEKQIKGLETAARFAEGAEKEKIEKQLNGLRVALKFAA